MSNYVFLCENEPVLLQIFWGRAPRPPPPHLPQFSDTILKKRNKEVQTKSRIKITCLTPKMTPPPLPPVFYAENDPSGIVMVPSGI